MSPDRLLDVWTVARRFNVSEETIRAWIRSGKLVAVVTPTGRYRIPASAVPLTKTQKSQRAE